MLTAAISALIVGVLALFGVKLSLQAIAVVVVVVKVLVVGGIMGLTAKFMNKPKAADTPRPTAVEPAEPTV